MDHDGAEGRAVRGGLRRLRRGPLRGPGLLGHGRAARRSARAGCRARGRGHHDADDFRRDAEHHRALRSAAGARRHRRGHAEHPCDGDRAAPFAAHEGYRPRSLRRAAGGSRPDPGARELPGHRDPGGRGPRRGRGVQGAADRLLPNNLGFFLPPEQEHDHGRRRNGRHRGRECLREGLAPEVPRHGLAGPGNALPGPGVRATTSRCRASSTT
jgi:hypothetical protein